MKRGVIKTAVLVFIAVFLYLLTPVAGPGSDDYSAYADSEVVCSFYEDDGIVYDLYTDDGDRCAMMIGYTGSGGEVIIPESVAYDGQDYTVVEIGSEIFDNPSAITAIHLPETIYTIGSEAFWHTGISEIVIPEGVRWINNSAFSGCENLTKVTLPSTLNNLEDYAFCGCMNLAELTSYVPSTQNVYVGEAAFGCWRDENDNLVYAPSGQLVVSGYGGEIMEYASEHHFGLNWMSEPVKEIRLATTDNLNPKYGDTVSSPMVTMTSTDSHAQGHLHWDAVWYDSKGNVMEDGTTVDTDNATLYISVSAWNKHLDFSKTKVYLNKLQLATSSGFDRVTASYGPIDTGAVKLTVKAECKGSYTKGKVSLDNVNFDSEKSKISKADQNETMYAQAGADSVFIEWRKDDPKTGTVVGTNPTLTVTMGGTATYYAIFGKTFPSTGNLGERATYVFDAGTGTVTISPVGWSGDGQGIQMENFDETPFNGTQKIKHVVFENGFYLLDDGLFIDEDNIESVSIPATMNMCGVQKHGMYASAFARCDLVGSGFTVDSDNPYLKAIDGSLYNKDGTTMYTFFRGPGEKVFTVPDNVNFICMGCFSELGLDKLILQGDGLRLENYAFISCNIKDIEVREGVTDLGQYGENTGPTSVTLPSTLESAAFNCAILGATTLENIDVADGNTHFKGIGGVLYKILNDGNLGLYVFPHQRDATDFVTPEDVTVILEYSFYRISKPMNITLSEDVITVQRKAIETFRPITLTVLNPGCSFETLSVDCGDTVKISAAEGSLAHQLYQQHADNTKWSFEALETSSTPLAKPKNLKWEGDTLKWDVVTGAKSYEVNLYKKDSKGNESKVAHQTVSAPRFDYDAGAVDCYWYKTDQYWCTVKAYGAGYQPSEKATSAKRAGNYYTVADLNAAVTGDALDIEPYVEPYIHEHDHFMWYGVDYIDPEGHVVVSKRYVDDSDPHLDLRAIAKVYALPDSVEYRLVVCAYTSRQGFSTVPVSNTKELTWYYGSKNINDCTFPDSLPNATYGGSAIVQPIEVYDGATLLLEGTDYVIEGRNNVNAGTAELVITGRGSYGGAKVMTFKILPKEVTPSVTLSTSVYTYNRSVRTPAVTVKSGSVTLKKDKDYAAAFASGRKNVGKYSVKVDLKGNYKGTKTVYLTINPKGTSISKLKKAKKAITVKWKKQSAKMATSRITGYQILLATNSSFTQNKKLVTVKGYKKISKKVTKLKGKKKYYVKVRTYKTVSGVNYYSTWSKVKTTKTK